MSQEQTEGIDALLEDLNCYTLELNHAKNVPPSNWEEHLARFIQWKETKKFQKRAEELKEIKSELANLDVMLKKREEALNLAQFVVTEEEVNHKFSDSIDYLEEEEERNYASHIIPLHDLSPIVVPCPVESICTFKGEHTNVSLFASSLNVSPPCHRCLSNKKWNHYIPGHLKIYVVDFSTDSNILNAMMEHSFEEPLILTEINFVGWVDPQKFRLLIYDKSID